MIDNEFVDTIVYWGLIVKTDLNTLQVIKEYIATLPNVKLIYQKPSFDRLRIISYSGSSISEGRYEQSK